MSERPLLEQSVASWLAAVAGDEPAPGGGGAAAVTVATGAALAGMSARLAVGHLDAAPQLAERADVLRGRAEPLADADATAYRAVLAAYRLPRDDGEARRARIRTTLIEAADVPLTIAELGCEVAEVALGLAESGNPNLLGDALTAALLASAAARSAATLAELNLAGVDDPERSRRAAQLHERAGELTDRAARR